MRLRKLDEKAFSHDFVAILFVLIFAIAGIGYLVASHAQVKGYMSRNQFSSFKYATNTSARLTHSNKHKLLLQFDKKVKYHSSAEAVYQFSLPAKTVASSLDMNVSYTTGTQSTAFVASGSPANRIWSASYGANQSKRKIHLSLPANTTVIYFGISATGSSGGVSGSFSSDRFLKVNAYAVRGKTVVANPKAANTPPPPATGNPPEPVNVTVSCSAKISAGDDVVAAIARAPAGSTVCLNPGRYASPINIYISHGTNGAPVTLSSADPSRPAVIANALTVYHSANYVTLAYLNFDWVMPKPWACWSTSGSTIPGQVISEPYSSGHCQAGTPNPADHGQIVIDGGHTRLTGNDITSENTNICLEMSNYGGTAEYTLIDHNRIHDCGPLVTNAWPTVNQQWGWHTHGIYDFGNFTTISNNYIYDNGRNGILFYPTGNGGTAEYNIIDGNGNGVTIDGNSNVTVRRNIITNSHSPRGDVDFGVNVVNAAHGNSMTDNCLGGNSSGDISASGVILSGNKKGVNPQYQDAARRNFKLRPGSPCRGYGPDTAQP